MQLHCTDYITTYTGEDKESDIKEVMKMIKLNKK